MRSAGVPVSAVVTALKQFFSELREPVIPLDLYDDLKDAVSKSVVSQSSHNNTTIDHQSSHNNTTVDHQSSHDSTTIDHQSSHNNTVLILLDCSTKYVDATYC